MMPFHKMNLSCNAYFAQVDEQLEQADLVGKMRRQNENDANLEDRSREDAEKEQNGVGAQQEDSDLKNDAACLSRSESVHSDRGTQVSSKQDLIHC